VAALRIDTRGDATLVLTGELDLAGEQRLEAAIARARASAGALTIDLSGLEFIDSSGLRVLVRLHNASLREGFTYTVIPGPPPVHRTFALCGLDVTLPFAA
jgi:anti-anti-sigma factor